MKAILVQLLVLNYPKLHKSKPREIIMMMMVMMMMMMIMVMMIFNEETQLVIAVFNCALNN